MKSLLLAILLAMTVSARADKTIYYTGPPATGVNGAGAIDITTVVISPQCPGNGLIPPGSVATFTYISAPSAGNSYAVVCVGPCNGFDSAVTTSIGGNFAFTAGPLTDVAYTFKVYGTSGTTGVAITNSNLKFTHEVVTGGCAGNDPIINGFDGSTFHFDELGEYVMLESGDGYKIHSTFAGATAANSELEVMERSWTSSVRVFSPNGDMVSCALPAIVPNTSRLQVTAVSGSETTLLSTDKQSIELAEMSASVVLSEGEGPKYVTGCMLTTPKLKIRVDQVSGYEQASKFPDTEAWAAPFTWLNAGFQVTKPLASPVTGILGATYPADKVAEQYALAAGGEATKTSATMNGELPGPKTHRRALAAKAAPFLPISSGIVGMSA